MEKIFSASEYDEMIRNLFNRFPSFQKAGAGAYKPGIANMEFVDQMMGHPHKRYKVIHVAGTNGKGSVSNMLASVLASSGYRVGLYTSPHISDFRERMRVVSADAGGAVGNTLISKECVWNFVNRWQETFDHLDMSFFEITTLMALDWFADQNVDWVVLETGLGGRLDSTNIVCPVLSVITNIGLDHCDLLGATLPEIAFEKAGIIKPKVPVVIGESNVETDVVFERKVLYSNLPEPEFMGNREAIMSHLVFADKVVPRIWGQHEKILSEMDLQGEYQKKNLRTVLASVDVLLSKALICGADEDTVADAIIHTASYAGFRGRWEKVLNDPCVICDIGHNSHGLRHNFSQLANMVSEGECSELVIVYGSVADKDVDSVIHLMPEGASFVFTQASSRRSLPAVEIREKYMEFCSRSGRVPGLVQIASNVADAIDLALKSAEAARQKGAATRPLIYVGGSTYVVSEAVEVLDAISSRRS